MVFQVEKTQFERLMAVYDISRFEKVQDYKGFPITMHFIVRGDGQ